MGRSFMLSLSVTFVLVGLLYVFMKQKLVTSEGKLNTLFGVVQQLAGEIQNLKDRHNHASPPSNLGDPVSKINEDKPETIKVSDDESNESDDDSVEDSEIESENESGNESENESGNESGNESRDDNSDDEGGLLTMKESDNNSNMKKEDVATMEISVEEISTDVPIENLLLPDTGVQLETDLQPMEINLEITPLDSESTETSKIVEVDLDEDLSKLSVKELKGRVESIKGPPLKTKKALIEYLNSKK